MKPLFSKQDFLLRDMAEDDISIVLKWRNDERIRMNMHTDHIISEEEHASWFKDVLHRIDTKYLILEYLGQPVGQSNAVNIDYENSKCYWGLYIGETESCHGCGVVMEYFTLSYIFEKIGIRKLCSEVFSFNKKTLKLQQRFGFKQEGCLKKHTMKNGTYEDIICFALFKEQWPEIKESIKKRLFK